MKQYKIAAFMLASLLLVSCGTTAPLSDVTETSDNSDSLVSDAQFDSEPTPDIPDDLDFEGETITILYRDEMKNEFWTEESNGEVVNDAVFARNAAVEDRLNCTLEYIPNTSTDWYGGYQAVISNSILAGDEAYDIISGPSFHIPTLIVDGYLYDLSTVDYVDFNQPWWTQSLLETTSFGGKIYLVSGDISLGMIKYLHCTYFNKRLASDYGIEDLYQTVLSGKWTVDKMNELCTDRTTDLNGDGQISLNDDSFGYVITNTTLWRAYIDALGVNYLHIGSDGYPEFDFSDSRSFEVCDLFTKWVGPGSSKDIIIGQGNDSTYEIFKSGRALFVMGRFVDSETTYREMTDDYGILPIPKWDESQDYHVTINGSESTFGIPVNSSKTDRLGAVLELLAYESYKTVTPAYYEEALKIKYTRDDTAAQIIDIIKNGARFNPTVQMSKLLGGTDYYIIECAVAGSSLATKFASIEKSMTAKLDEVLELIS